MPIKPAYEGEAQLVRWAESAAAGRTVTLRIDEDAATHAFKGLRCGDQGQRMQIVAVLVDDNEEAQDPDHARANKRKKGHKALTKPAEPFPSDAQAPERSEPVEAKRSYTRSQMAAIKCSNQEFQHWFLTNHNVQPQREKMGLPLVGDLSRDQATALVERSLRAIISIESKKELDVPGPAQEAFDKLMTDFDMRNYTR